MNLMAGGVKWESFGAKSDFAIVYKTITANDIKTCCHMGTEQRDKVSGPTPSSKQLKGLKQSSQSIPALPSLSEDCYVTIFWKVPIDTVSAPERSSHSLNITTSIMSRKNSQLKSLTLLSASFHT